MMGGGAHAGCVVNGATQDCTGDLSGGVQLNNGGGPITTLNVLGLTTDIAPPSGAGIRFDSNNEVTLNVTAGPFSIVTSGDMAPAITATSTSGGVTINAFADIVTNGLQSHGIAAVGQGGDVLINAFGNISTAGNATSLADGAIGISALSSSGSITINSAVNIVTTGSFGTGINAVGDGDVYVASTGNVVTTGDDAYGIIAASSAGTATVLSWGNVSATGAGSAGIVAQGQDALVVNGGTVIGGPCCGAVMLGAGNTAVLLNFGSVIGNSTGEAIYAAAPDVLVENFGTVTGDVTLFGISAIFNNHAGALFNSGAVVDATDVFNHGTLSPGGSGLLQPTAIDGNFTQGAAGKLAIELLGAGGYSDQVFVSGTAALAGNVVLSMLLPPVDPIQSFVILSATSVMNNGLGLIASPALHAALSFDSNNVYLGIAVDFRVGGLNANQRAIAAAIERIYLGGAASAAPVLLGLVNVGSLDEYKNALDQLSPQIYSAAEIGALYSSLAFSNSLLSCKVNGTDTASIIREGQCLWAGASARFLDTGTTSKQIGFDETAGLFTAGAQVALDNVWRLGVAGGFQSSTLHTATGATSDGSLGQAGIALKYNPGPALLAAAITGGGATYDTRRPMSFGGFTGVAEGNQALGLFSGTLRAAYVLGSPHLYAKPMLDMSLTHLQLGGFTESGGGGAALSIEGGGHTVFALTPAVEVGTEFWLPNGTLVRPLIRAGAVWYDNADFATTASFADAPLGIAPFTIETEIDQTMGLVGAGLDVINGEDAALRLSYDGQLGTTTQIHSVGIKGSSRF